MKLRTPLLLFLVPAAFFAPGGQAGATPTDQSSSTSTGLSDIGAVTSSSDSFRITKIARLRNSHGDPNDLDLAFADLVAGSTYRLERSFALTPPLWGQIAQDFTAAQNGPIELIFVDAAALPANQTKIFYRLRLLP